MKNRILITSILLSLTTVALIGYFVGGCSSLKDVALRQREDQRVANAEVKEADAVTKEQPKVAAEPTDSSGKVDFPKQDQSNLSKSKLIQVEAKIVEPVVTIDLDEARKPNSRTDSLVMHDVAVTRIDPDPAATKPVPPAYIGTPGSRRLNEEGGLEGRERHTGVARGPDTGSPVAGNRDVVTFGDEGASYQSKYSWSGVDTYDDSSSFRNYRSVNGDMMGGMGGMMGGGIMAGDPNGSAGGMMGGGMGGMGGYGGGMMGGEMGGGMGGRGSSRYGGVQPTGPQTGKRTPGLSHLPTVGGLFRRPPGQSGSVSVRSVPVELINVSADELWIIAKSEVQSVPIPPDDEGPGTGAMLAKLPKKDKKIPLPLKHTDVEGQISGYIATVNVTQQFHNPFDEKIEAVYVFPLPQNAAINEFIMTVGGRRIRGIIRERKQAERIYQQARAQGHVASLLTQERPNIFTQKVANIEPGKKIDVNIKYFNTLAYVDGWYEFVFPMVVGPRFNPPGFTDGVGAVARGRAGISGQKTEVQYLKPGERSGHDISLAVDIDAGVAIEKLVCKSHVISNSSASRQRKTVKLSSFDSIPNKDFVLRYKVAGKKVKSALVTHRDKRGGFFTLMLYPPENLSYLKRAPMEMIFVLDCSGSMRGKPIAKAKQAITRALRKLQPGDTFQVIRFSNNASQLGPNPVPATPANIRRGLQYVESLRGSGGTMMIEGIKAALGFAHDPRRFRLVSFMTDGYIGNEAEILAEVHNSLGASRIFSFGVGSSVNRYLLDRMAKIGKGAVAYIGLDDSTGEVVDQFYDRISHPALADVEIDWGSMEVADVQPYRIPDLFVGRPVIVTGRFAGQDSTSIRVTGRVGDLAQEMEIPVHLGNAADTHPGIPCVWARKKIETLDNLATYDTNPDLPGAIRQVALEYGLMSSYTAFIAVDSSRKTEGDHGVTVAVPVPVPDGVRYETTVQN